MHRFFLSNLQETLLAADEAHHALHVLRLRVGDAVNVFDGRGHEAQASISQISGQTVHLTLLQQSSTPALRCRITLAQAIPKRNMDLIVQKATELGVAVIVPLISERTLMKLDGDTGEPVSKNARVDRWREIALEACKQCGNNWLPEIQPPQKAATFLNSLPKADLKLIASLQPDARPLKQILSNTPALQHANSASILLLIGPEGDFTPAELNLARAAGCLPLSLGPLILRAETAALYALSILHHELQVTAVC